MIINRTTLANFFTGIQTAFNGAFLKTEVVYEAYTMSVPSTTGQEQYGWMGMIPGFREWVGDRQLNNISTYDFVIKNKKWEDTLVVKGDHLEDDTYGIYNPMAEALAEEGKRHPQELTSALLLNAWTGLAYDGQPFINSNHPVTNADGTVGLVSNNGGGSGAPWFLIDDTRSVKPLILQKRRPVRFVSMQDLTDDRVFMADEFIFGADWRGNVGYGLWQLIYGSKQTLDETNYQAARAAMQTMTGDKGRKLGLRPKLLVCGPSNETAAKKLLEAESLANGSTNVNRGTAKLVVDPYLP